ncbi:MAG: 7-cyano-7-deazaguanine synthase [Candidatus Lokiarchaeota archaeon]|nr:7-cyano-7-deazaguanine synthase [Candidatus Lokiarchaeota archaeon]
MLLKLVKELNKAIKNKTNLIWGSYNTLTEQLISVMLDFPERPKDFKLKIQKPKEYKKVILVSGGMDSSIMWKINDKEKDKIGLYVDFRQNYALKEKKAIMDFGIKAEFINYDLSNGITWEHIIPTRNFLLIALAEGFTSHEGEIWIGAVQGETVEDKGDKSELFFRLVEEFIWRTKHKKVFIKTLKAKTKNDWLKDYIKETGDMKILDTVTCFSGTDSEKGCGKCQACVRKWIALQYCKIDNISNYFEEDPYIGGKKYIENYKVKMTKALKENDFSHYSEKRCNQDLNVILNYENVLSGGRR